MGRARRPPGLPQDRSGAAIAMRCLLACLLPLLLLLLAPSIRVVSRGLHGAAGLPGRGLTLFLWGRGAGLDIVPETMWPPAARRTQTPQRPRALLLPQTPTRAGKRLQKACPSLSKPARACQGLPNQAGCGRPWGCHRHRIRSGDGSSHGICDAAGFSCSYFRPLEAPSAHGRWVVCKRAARRSVPAANATQPPLCRPHLCAALLHGRNHRIMA